MIRLAALLHKKSLSSAEETEMKSLVEMAKAADLDLYHIKSTYADDDVEEEDEDEEDGVVTEEQLGAMITGAVEKAIASAKLDKDSLLREIRDSLGSKGASASAEIEQAISRHLEKQPKVNKAELIAEIKSSMPSVDDFGNRLAKEFAKLTRESRHQFPVAGGGNDYPCEFRGENITVGQKQLFNLCLRAMPENARTPGTKAPTDINDGISQEHLSHAARRGAEGVKSVRQMVKYGSKALTTTGVGSGAELIPSDLSSDLMMRLYLESPLATEMIASEVNMPTDPFSYPLVTSRVVFKKGSEAPGSNPTSSTPGTAALILSTSKLIGVAEYSYEANEDSIFAMLPMLQENMGAGAADSFESALINGDTTGTHQDSDIHAVTDHAAKCYKGFRKLAIAGSLTVDCSTGGLNLANFIAAKKLMGKYGIKPKDLLLLVGVNGYNDVVALDETLTFDKLGNAAAARINSGEATSLMSTRIVTSAQVREDLNANGVYDGSTTTKGSFLLIHRPSFLVGTRRGFTVEVDVDKFRQINSVIASFRRDFKPHETPSANLPMVVMGRNYTAA